MKLLAPNGKPTNLTPEQYRLVRTPAFKKWFGDWENSPETASKVVDENGEPLMVYHGSPYGTLFNVFDGSDRGNWFGENIKIAETYRDKYVEDWEQLYEDKEIKERKKERKIFNVFLKAKKIYDLSFVDAQAEQTKEEFNKIFPVNLRWGGYKTIGTPHWELFEVSYDIIKKWLIKNKYDCIKIKERGYITYGVFEPTQIKLADGSNTTFDGSNPDIRYKEGGLVESELNKIKEAYELGNNYYEGILNGEEFKIRMNKNHPRNWARNDDSNIHNLSLVNVKIPSAVGTRVVYNKVQKQVDNIIDWDDAESEIKEFFYEISEYEKFYDGGSVKNNQKNITKIKELFLKNGFTKENLSLIEEENKKYFNNIEFINNETLIVYRTLALPKRLANKFIKLDKKEIGKGIGEYWSFDKELARAIWGGGHYESEETFDTMCVGYLKIKDIDWEMMKYAFNDDLYHFTSESEIRGKKGGEVIKVIKCYLLEEELSNPDISYSDGGSVDSELIKSLESSNAVEKVFSNQQLSNIVYKAILENENFIQRNKKYAAQNKIMEQKQIDFVNGQGMEAIRNKLIQKNTEASNAVADLITIELANIRAKQFDYKTEEGKAKSKEQYDIKNAVIEKLYKQYIRNNWIVRYEPSTIPNIKHTLFFTLPESDIQMSYHGNFENLPDIEQLPKGKWDGIAGATFHKLEEKSADILGEKIEDTHWRKGVDLGFTFVQKYSNELTESDKEGLKTTQSIAETYARFSNIPEDKRYPDQNQFIEAVNDILQVKAHVAEKYSISEVEHLLGRKLHWWSDSVITIKGNDYKKVYLQPYYQLVN